MASHSRRDKSSGPVARFRCKHCGKTVERASEKMWVKSHCDKTDRTVHLVRVSAPRALHYYAAAGELFGHLRESLGFGELVMFTRTWGQSAPPRVMAYQWTFNVKGERYCCEESIPFVELEHMRSVEEFAEHLSHQWKNLVPPQ